jgi:hypothetical protein
VRWHPMRVAARREGELHFVSVADRGEGEHGQHESVGTGRELGWQKSGWRWRPTAWRGRKQSGAVGTNDGTIGFAATWGARAGRKWLMGQLSGWAQARLQWLGPVLWNWARPKAELKYPFFQYFN